MQVIPASPADIPAWLELSREVEELFGAPMAADPGFYQALARNIERGSAFCVREQDGPPGAPLCGGLLFSSTHAPSYELGWLAVAERWRQAGVGRALVEYAAALITPPAELTVITFTEDDPGGAPARRFYLRLGFDPAELVTVPNPPGAVRQVYRKLIR